MRTGTLFQYCLGTLEEAVAGTFRTLWALDRDSLLIDLTGSLAVRRVSNAQAVKPAEWFGNQSIEKKHEIARLYALLTA